jgi:hypothetical protein
VKPSRIEYGCIDRDQEEILADKLEDEPLMIKPVNQFDAQPKRVVPTAAAPAALSYESPNDPVLREPRPDIVVLCLLGLLGVATGGGLVAVTYGFCTAMPACRLIELGDNPASTRIDRIILALATLAAILGVATSIFVAWRLLRRRGENLASWWLRFGFVVGFGTACFFEALSCAASVVH